MKSVSEYRWFNAEQHREFVNTTDKVQDRVSRHFEHTKQNAILLAGKENADYSRLLATSDARIANFLPRILSGSASARYADSQQNLFCFSTFLSTPELNCRGHPIR